MEDLSISPAHLNVSSTATQLAIPNNSLSSGISTNTTNTNLLRATELPKDDNNDSGIIINVDDAEESADFVYPRMYTSTLNVVIK